MSITQQIINKLSYAAVFLSPDGYVLHANDAAEALLGRGVVGRTYLTLMRQPNLVQAIETALRDGISSQISVAVISDGSNLTHDVMCDCIDDAGRHVLVQFLDTSDQDKTVQMRRDFVANVSHELKTPLTALNGFIETLQGPARDDDTARDRFLNIMSRETGRMTRLVDDLLSLSKVERDQKVRPTTQVDIAAVLRSVVLGFEPRAAQLDMKIDLIQELDQIMCLADEDQIRQVFSNLMENGLKYGRSPKGLQIILTEESNTSVLKKHSIRIDFKDYGAGFDPIYIPRLGERFYRIDDHRARAEGGTGLGLAIVKHILKRHKGALRIDTKLGIGSTFTAYIPVT